MTGHEKHDRRARPATPTPEKGEWYRVRVFTDSAGLCPDCKARKAAAR